MEGLEEGVEFRTLDFATGHAVDGGKGLRQHQQHMPEFFMGHRGIRGILCFFSQPGILAPAAVLIEHGVKGRASASSHLDFNQLVVHDFVYLVHTLCGRSRGGRAGSRLPVREHETLQGLNRRIGGTGSGLLGLQFAVLTAQAVHFLFGEFLVDEVSLTLKTKRHGCVGVLQLATEPAFHSLHEVGSALLRQLHSRLHAANFAADGVKAALNLAAAVLHLRLQVMRGVDGTVALVADGRDDASDAFADFGIQLNEALSAGILGGADTVVKADDALAVVASAFLESDTIGRTEAAPAAVAQQEQQKEDGHEFAVVAETAVVTAVTAQGEQARQVHVLVVLHEGQQAGDVVVHGALLFDIFVEGFKIAFDMIQVLSHAVRNIFAHGLLPVVKG